MIHIAKTQEAIRAAGHEVWAKDSWSDKNRRISLAAQCRKIGIEPIMGTPKADREFYPSMI